MAKPKPISPRTAPGTKPGMIKLPREYVIPNVDSNTGELTYPEKWVSQEEWKKMLAEKEMMKIPNEKGEYPVAIIGGKPIYKWASPLKRKYK